MKNSTLMILIPAFIIGVILTSCNTPVEKVEKTQNEVAIVNQKLVKEEYLVDVEIFRKESYDKIMTNSQNIAEFKTRVNNNKEETKFYYDWQILKLERRNSDIKKTIDNYKADGKEKWTIFKKEFTQDMNKLDRDFKKLAQKKSWHDNIGRF